MKGFNNAWLDRDEPAGDVRLSGWTRATEDDLRNWEDCQHFAQGLEAIPDKELAKRLPKLSYDRKYAVWLAHFPSGTQSFEDVCRDAVDLLRAVTGGDFVTGRVMARSSGEPGASVSAVMSSGRQYTLGSIGWDAYSDRTILAVSPSLLLQAGLNIDGDHPRVELLSLDRDGEVS